MKVLEQIRMHRLLLAHFRFTSSLVQVSISFLDTTTVQRKILTGVNIDEFDEFPAIHQYFPYQNFPFS